MVSVESSQDTCFLVLKRKKDAIGVSRLQKNQPVRMFPKE